MTKSIPIRQAEAFAIANQLQQVIIFGHDGTTTHVVTWGDTAEHAAQAAAGANHIKKKWGWPDDTIVESAKVQELKARISELEEQLSLTRSCVHVIQCTEYERGWGQRPEGYMAFATEKDALQYCVDYDKKHNNERTTPDWYMKWTYLGVYDCSHAIARNARQSPILFDKLSELKPETR